MKPFDVNFKIFDVFTYQFGSDNVVAGIATESRSEATNGVCPNCRGPLYEYGFDIVCHNCSQVIEREYNVEQERKWKDFFETRRERADYQYQNYDEYANSGRLRCQGGYPHPYDL